MASEYEILRQQRIEERMKMLNAIGVDEARDDFRKAAENTIAELHRSTSANGKRDVKRKYVKRQSPVQTRMQTRSITRQISEDKKTYVGKKKKVTVKKRRNNAVEDSPEISKRRRPNNGVEFSRISSRPESATFTAEQCLDDSTDHTFSLFRLTHNGDHDSFGFDTWADDRKDFVEQIKKFRCAGHFKITKNRCLSLIFHPSPTKLIAVAGDKHGQIGFVNLTNVNDGAAVEMIKYWAHTAPVNCMAFEPSTPNVLYSSCNEIGLQKFDLEKGVFKELLRNDFTYRYFDFTDPNTVLLSSFEGMLSKLDLRDSRNPESHDLAQQRLKTVHVHPTDKNYFITACSKGIVSLWDVRKFGKTQEAVQEMKHERSVQSALFSPLTGSSIIVSSMDHRYTIWRDDENEKYYKQAASVKHNNKTGRFLTSFRPVWHPAREDFIISGSLDHPRVVEVFDSNLRLRHRLGQLSCVCSLNAFHPTAAVVVGATSSGYLYMWR